MPFGSPALVDDRASEEEGGVFVFVVGSEVMLPFQIVLFS